MKKMAESLDSRARILEFDSQFYYLINMWPLKMFTFYVPQFFYLYNGNNNKTYVWGYKV